MIREDIKLRVGRDKQIALDGVLLEPSSTKSHYTLIFTPGISSKYQDYATLIESFGEQTRVIAYNLRGHGTSEGAFDPPKLIEDLEDIIQEQTGPVCLLGQSVGAGISAKASARCQNVKAVYMLTPYLGIEFLGRKQRAGIRTLRALTFIPGPLQVADAVLYFSGISQPAGFNNRQPLQDLGRLVKIKSAECKTNKPVAWLVSSCDEVTGTLNNPAHYEFVRKKLKEMYPDGEDHSEFAQGLNHCLNLTKGDMRPFLKPENGKNGEQILTRIVDFYARTLLR